MKDTKLLFYFKAFTEKEWEQFGYFISTPLYNTAPAINRLFDFIKQNRGEEGADKEWKQKVFSYVFPGLAYKDGQLRTLFWRMTKLIETFLALQHLLSEDERLDEQLIMALGKRNAWFPLFKKKINQKTKSQKGAVLEMNSLLHSVNLYQHLYFHSDFSSYELGFMENQKLNHELDQFIILAKLKFHFELLFRKQVLSEGELAADYLDFVVPQILKNEKKYEGEPVIMIYIKLIRMKQSGDLKQYHEAKQYFKEFSSGIGPEDQRNVYYYLINFIIFIGKQQVNPLNEESLELYQVGLDSGVLVINRRISYVTFTNIVVLGSILKRFAWTDVFIRKYQKFLEPSIAGLAVKLARAFWHFHQGAFEKVLDWTQDIDMHEDQPSHPFRLRALKLRAYYELSMKHKSYKKLLKHFIIAFTRFIKNNRKLSRQQAIAYLNFLKVVKKLLKAVDSSGELNEEQKQNLQLQVKEINPMALKQWLIEKIENG